MALFSTYDISSWGHGSFAQSNTCPVDLEIFENLTSIKVKHPAGIKEAFGKKCHFRVLNGETNELMLEGVQPNGFTCRKPITIYSCDEDSSDEVLRVDIKSEGLFGSLKLPERATVSILPGTVIGIIKPKLKWFTVNFEIMDGMGNVHFTVKSKENLFKASEYPIIDQSGREVGRIYRSVAKIKLTTAAQLHPIIKSIFLGFVLFMDCLARESSGTPGGSLL